MEGATDQPWACLLRQADYSRCPSYLCTEPSHVRALFSNPQGVAQDFLSFPKPESAELSSSHRVPLLSPRAPLSAVTPAPPEAAEQAAFVVWAQAAPGSGTKGEKKAPILLGPAAALSHCGPSAPGEPGGAAAWPHGGKQAKPSPE